MEENAEKAMEGVEETVAGEAPSIEGAPMDKNPSSDSESSSDSDDDEGEEELQIQTLEKQLVENQWNYEAHVQYIHILRKLGHIEKLRQARESMNEHFPLSPKMWQEWTKDEASLSIISDTFTEIEKLYELGVHEYMFVPLWCDYLNFVQEHDHLVSQCAPAGVSKMRNLFERALTAGGLHIVEGNKIWEAYREYEQAILLTIDDSCSEEKAKQVQRIRAVFHRQLSVPLVDLGSTLMAYKNWQIEQGNSNDIISELDELPHNVASAYQRALEMYKVRTVYEVQLSNSDGSDADRLEHFKNYIKFEESNGDPARVQIVYERAVTEFPVSPDLWMEYTSYLDRTLKVPNVLKNVYSRATRNCTWLGDLWVCYMLSLERMHASEKELSAVFEQSMRCVFLNFREYLDLFLTRIDGLRRRISMDGTKEGGLDYTLIRETFQHAVDYLSPQLVSIDDLLRLHAYWARLEANIGKNLDAARGVWENLIKKSGSMLEVWQSYVSMEIEMGHIDEARSIYKRCYSKRFMETGSKDICNSWLRFEREYGTLDDLDLAVKKVTPRLKELMIFKAQQEFKSDTSFSVKKESHLTSNTPQKRKMTSEKQPAAKRQRDTEPTSVDSSFVDPRKKSRNISDGGVVATSHKTTGTDASDERHIEDLKASESKPKFYSDQCTAFISNISLEANEKQLGEFFNDSGGVAAIRLLKDKFTGKSRGLAYVDFSNDEHLAAAVAKNRQKLLGKKLSIVRSDPQQSKKRTSSNTSSFRGRGRKTQFRSGHSGKREESNEADTVNRRSDVKLVGKNTFAAPRAVVKPLGRSSKEAKVTDNTDMPRSNDDFREMLLK